MLTDVGGIAHDEIESPAERRGQRPEQVALQHLHGEPEAFRVRPRELGCRRGDVHREDARVGTFRGDGERDGTGPRPDVDDGGIGHLRDGIEGGLDDDLGLGPRDEHAGTDLKDER